MEIRRRLLRKPEIQTRLLCNSTRTSTVGVTRAFQVSHPDQQDQKSPDQRDNLNWIQQLLQQSPTNPRQYVPSQSFQKPCGGLVLRSAGGARANTRGGRARSQTRRVNWQSMLLSHREPESPSPQSVW